MSVFTSMLVVHYLRKKWNTDTYSSFVISKIPNLGIKAAIALGQHE